MSFSFGKVAYKTIKEYAELIEDLYNLHRITIPQNSELAQYIFSARQLSDSWYTGDRNTLDDRDVFFKKMGDSLLILRLGYALKYLKEKPELEHHLTKLLEGSIDPTDKKVNQAKDFCFEILVASKLEAKGLKTNLFEPDIRFEIDGMGLVIACKHPHPQNLNSLEINLEEKFRKATRQIKKSSKRGFIAISLDSIVPQRNLVSVKNTDELDKQMDSYCTSFVVQYENNFKRWINSEKVLGVIACLSTITIIDDIKLPGEAQFWTVHFACSETSPYWKVGQSLEKLLSQN
ncbi:MAG: hypothetical protein A2Z27_00905 [candidate division Zixibacteria bacterium RBG_16_50_21]|nr:MAG: hypothetical protein A2Z27_00905 [candidate division Zixibacteria bacterium RBG_16_50_21]